MQNNTKYKITEYIKKQSQVNAKELAEYLEISKQAMFRHLSELLEQNKITKIGRPPKVFYLIKEFAKIKKQKFNISEKLKNIIKENFLIITPSGEKKQGLDAFSYWCEKQNLSFEKTALEYEKILKKYNAFKKAGLISGMKKIKSTFNKAWLDYVYYLDFYSIERFGKTKLGQLLLYAKQSQSKKLIKELIEIVKPDINKIIKKHKIQAIGFIPPTVKREVQFMRELQKNLNFKQRIISIIKIKTQVPVPQKTLNKLEDRIENARNTIIVDEKNKFNNIILIDDAVGSGATLNETAKQIKHKKIAKKVIGVSITGSFKGFDVISEV